MIFLMVAQNIRHIDTNSGLLAHNELRLFLPWDRVKTYTVENFTQVIFFSFLITMIVYFSCADPCNYRCLGIGYLSNLATIREQQARNMTNLSIHCCFINTTCFEYFSKLGYFFPSVDIIFFFVGTSKYLLQQMRRVI